MKQNVKAILCTIGMMVIMSPAALGQEADAVHSPDTLRFTIEIGCPDACHVADLAVMCRTLTPLSGEARNEALHILKQAMEDPELLRDYFELEYGSNIDDIDLNNFTVIAQQDDEDDGERGGQSDRIDLAYFSEDTIILHWRDAGWTSQDEPRSHTQTLSRSIFIDMYFVVRHEYEVSQTPKRDSR
jgi:hypothetical protein